MGSHNAIIATNTTFASNIASSGGAAFITGPSEGSGYGSFSCLNCMFSSNQAQQSGGALMATGSMQLHLSSSEATGNAALAGDGGAVLCLGCQLLVTYGSLLTHNTAELGRGGGCSCLGCKHAVVDGLTARNNTASAGGALSLSLTGVGSRPGKLTSTLSAAVHSINSIDGIFGSTFEDNRAVISSCSAEAGSNCHRRALLAAGSAGIAVGVGGAVQLQTAGTFSVEGSRFLCSSAASEGGKLKDDCSFAMPLRFLHFSLGGAWSCVGVGVHKQ
jgi:predicted outer membrane repeat protein